MDRASDCGPEGPGSIPVKGTCLGCRFLPSLALVGAYAGDDQSMGFSHSDVYLCLCLSLFDLPKDQ